LLDFCEVKQGRDCHGQRRDDVPELNLFFQVPAFDADRTLLVVVVHLVFSPVKD